MSVEEERLRIERVKKSFAIGPKEEILSVSKYNKVLKGISGNVKMGPFKATSGVVLPYYINLATNFLDKHIAPYTVEIMLNYLDFVKKDLALGKEEKVLMVGMETLGGIMAAQLAGVMGSKLFDWMDYVFMRKERKKTGTQQQLEGPSEITNRTKDSPVVRGIWIDDCMSTGTSLVDGIKVLKEEYNIEIVCAFFLVDRSKDRQKLEKPKLADPKFDNLKIYAVFDLQEIDDLIKKP